MNHNHLPRDLNPCLMHLEIQTCCLNVCQRHTLPLTPSWLCVHKMQNINTGHPRLAHLTANCIQWILFALLQSIWVTHRCPCAGIRYQTTWDAPDPSNRTSNQCRTETLHDRSLQEMHWVRHSPAQAYTVYAVSLPKQQPSIQTQKQAHRHQQTREETENRRILHTRQKAQDVCSLTHADFYNHQHHRKGGCRDFFGLTRCGGLLCCPSCSIRPGITKLTHPRPSGNWSQFTRHLRTSYRAP